MRKIFLYPQWNYAKAEKFLADMEARGYYTLGLLSLTKRNKKRFI